MCPNEIVAPKHDLEAAIRRLIVARPHWFETRTYVVAHLTKLDQWCLQVYNPAATYKPSEIYEEHTTPPKFWWWAVHHDEDLLEHELHLILQNAPVSPMYVAVLHIGDAILEPDHCTLNIYDREPDHE